MKKHIEPLAYGLRDFASACGISLRTLYSHLSNGTGPETVRVGKRRLITREAAHAWLQAHTETKEAA